MGKFGCISTVENYIISISARRDMSVRACVQNLIVSPEPRHSLWRRPGGKAERLRGGRAARPNVLRSKNNKETAGK